jgi:hypothetical protein
LFAPSATFWTTVLLDDSGMQLGDLTGAYGARFESLLSAVVGRVTTRAELKWIGVTPDDQIAAKLVTTPWAPPSSSPNRAVYSSPRSRSLSA